MLVALGEFLSQHGLLDELMKVPIAQRARDFVPQTKLVEFLAAILSGSEHLEDLSSGAHPLAKDRVVGQAWGQPGWAHYSTVSRTLDACDKTTVETVERIVQGFSRPFIAKAIHELVLHDEAIVYDLDLTGQAVSSTSTSYPEAAFGWMDNRVKLGYQLARVSLSPEQGERIWLAGFHHPGDTVSGRCLKELIHAAEVQTGIRPRRRVEWVGQRIDAYDEVLARTRRLIEQHESHREKIQQTQVRLIGQLYCAEQAQKKPISTQQQARLQKQTQSWRKRQPRLEKQLTRTQHILAKHQIRLAEQESELAQLHLWQAQLEADNLANPDPPAYMEARMDSGFMSVTT